ncbi:D-2-hydroxyacid dehydrogenase [bacterium]|nr:D-2-hydroxyacid dehydrogenase [bacterium]
MHLDIGFFAPGEEKQIPLDFDILWCWYFPEQLLTQADRLVWVQSTGAGVDSFIMSGQLPAQTLITQSKGFHGLPMAEYVFGALLGHCKGLFTNLIANREQGRMAQLLPTTLTGQILGIIGTGSIGQEIARCARCFGMKNRGLRRSRNELAPFFDEVFTVADRMAFCHGLSYVIIVAPLTPETKGLIDHDFLYSLAKGAVLINVGRGEIIVEPDLIEALRSGQLSQAILDVWTGEKPDPELFRLENLLITPHFSGLFKEYADHAARIFTDNLLRFISGEKLLYLIDRERGY